MGLKGQLVRSLAEREVSKGKAVLFALRVLGLDGGPGSGNFGHSGRPGKVGGSGKGGGSAFRATSSETKSGYIGVQRAKAFKGITRAAQNSKDFNSFFRSLSKEQLDLIRDQHRQCGTNEKIKDYTERLRLMMSATKPEKIPENHVVEGKDLTKDYKRWNGEAYTEPKFGQVIDTEIEDVIVKQGFNGVPKVVSQEEMDKIIEEHPEMPILFRSYSAPNAEILQDYDDMLEKGEWYVDCETGGSQYGQGMYCAGVYQQEPLYDWKDQKFEPDDWTVFTINNEGYKAKRVDPEENTEAGDLIVDTPYLMIDKDGNRKIVKMDPDSLMFEDENGSLVDEDKITEALKTGKVFECKETDIGIYKDAYNKEREQGIKGALNEMDHYRGTGQMRCYEDYQPILASNEAYEDNGSKHGFWIFNKDQMKSVKDEKPKEGQEIAVTFYDKDGIPIKTRTGIYYDGELAYPDLLASAKVSDKDEWTPITRKDNRDDLKPQSSTRMMTLDPSAKIITYDEIRNIKSNISYMRDDAYREMERKINEFSDGDPEIKDLCTRYRIASEYGRQRMAESSEKGRRVVEEMDKITQEHREAVEKADSMARLGLMDEGALAALLGYDAINAEGHGDSGSYTVVLNRTKLIVSKNRVKVN